MAFAQSPAKDARIPSLSNRLKLPAEFNKFNSFVPPSSVNKTSRVSSINVCDTWTFQLKLGNAASVEKVNDIIQLPNGEYIIVGTYFDGSMEKGLIVKIDRQGNLLWSKTIEEATYDFSIKKIHLFSDGLLYAMAERKPIATTITTPILCAFDQNGNLQWSNVISVSGFAGSWQGIDVQEWRENSFSILIGNDSHFNISKLSLTNRTTIWSKTYKSRGNLNLVGLGLEYWDAYVGYNENDSGFRRGIMADIDYNTGNLRFAHCIGGIDRSDYFFQSMRMVNLRPRVTGYKVKNGVEYLIKQNYSPTSIPEAEEVFSVNNIPTSQVHTAQDYSTEHLAVTEGASPTDLYVVSTWPDIYNDPVSARKFAYSYPIELMNLIPCQDGGQFIASNSLDGAKDIVVTKTDSVGTLPGCSASAAPTSFTRGTVPYYQFSIPQLNNTVLLTSASLINQALTLQSNLECQNVYCPIVAEPDTCLRTFFKEYRNYPNCMIFYRGLKTTQNKIMVLGRGREVPYIADEQPYLNLFDTAGRVLESRVLQWEGVSAKLDINQIIRLKDGNYFGVGTIVYGLNTLELLAFKFDEQFNIIWSERMHPNMLLGGIGRVFESTEGDLYCWVFGTYGTVGQKVYLLKLNNIGSPLWFKRYDAGPDIFLGDLYGDAAMLELGSYLYFEYRETESSDWAPRILKLNKNDGSVVWAKKIPVANSTNWDVLNFLTDKKNLYIFSRNGPAHSLIKLSADGDMLLSKKIGNPLLLLSSATQKTDTSFILGVDRYTYPNVAYGAVVIDTAFNTLNEQFVQIPKSGGNADIIPFSDSVAYGVGSFFYKNPYWAGSFVQKFNFNGSFGSCQVTGIPWIFRTFP